MKCEGRRYVGDSIAFSLRWVTLCGAARVQDGGFENIV